MTVQEYIDQDLPFFHITPTRKVAHILRNGLKNLPNMLGQRLGICVVRSENQEILHIIAGEQLSGWKIRSNLPPVRQFKLLPFANVN